MKHIPYVKIVACPLLCIEVLCLYIILTVCHFSEKKQLNNIYFCYQFGHEDLKVSINCTLGYLVPTNYKYVHHYDENTNTEDVLHYIPISSSKKTEEMLPAMP